MNPETPQTPQVWLITGCSSGFGLAIARAALENGHRVVATARQPGTLAELADLYPAHCRTVALDVTDPAQIASAVDAAVLGFGRLDVLVNNAGYGLVGAFEELGTDQIHRNFAVNFFGALDVMRAVLPVMRAQKSGHIVNISAAAVIANYPGFSSYGATKWALEGVSESLAAELKPLGIRVTIVEPGPFRTDFIGRSLERGRDRIADYDRSSGKFLRFLESIDGKQPGNPGKAAQVILSAVSSASPPLRLVLGRYATDKRRKVLVSAERELAAWETAGLSTDDSPGP